MTGKKRFQQQLSELDNEVFSAFCDSFQGISWKPDFKDSTDPFCGIDLQLTGTTKREEKTYDIEIKSRITLTNFNVAKDCFFEWDKWFKLVEYNNDKKLYIAIYPQCNKIAIWNVCRELFEKSEKDLVMMNRSFCGKRYQVQKKVYRFKLEDAKVFDFNLTQYKDKYNAIYQQIADKKGQMEKTFQQ